MNIIHILAIYIYTYINRHIYMCGTIIYNERDSSIHCTITQLIPLANKITVYRMYIIHPSPKAAHSSFRYPPYTFLFFLTTLKHTLLHHSSRALFWYFFFFFYRWLILLPTITRHHKHTNFATGVRLVDKTNPQAKGRVSTDRSVETALPSTAPCLVRKSSTDNSKFRHWTNDTHNRPLQVKETGKIFLPSTNYLIRQSGLERLTRRSSLA